MEETIEMIDLHAHILPQLDDGAETLEESIQMCWISYQDGVRIMVATPHTLNGLYQNDRSTILSKVQEINEAIKKFGVQNPDPMVQRPNDPMTKFKVLPGADVHLCEATLRQVDQGQVMTIGDGGKYIMIEFPFQGIPFHAEEVLFQLMAREIVPIITHPERNLEIGQRPERYFEMIRMGCLGQLTAMSLTGELGPGVRRIAGKLLTHRLLHFIASDAHSLNGRPPVLSHAVREARKIVGHEEARRMVTEYPQAILEGRKPDVPDPIPFH